MADTQILTAIGQVHDKVNDFMLEQVEINTTMKNHIERGDLHKPHSTCATVLQVENDLREHEKGHDKTVRRNIATIVGGVVLVGLLGWFGSSAIKGIKEASNELSKVRAPGVQARTPNSQAKTR